MPALADMIFQKIGLNEIDLQCKTKELLRLLELKFSNNGPTQISEYGKIVLCADIAAGLLSSDFDRAVAMKLSGLRKSHYQNSKRLFEKLLGIYRTVSTKDICIQLGLNGVTQKANELMASYSKFIETDDVEGDINHPQYAAMAVFQACKIMKQKVLKPKILALSNLRPSQWTLLEQRWDKYIMRHCHTCESRTKTNEAQEITNLQEAGKHKVAEEKQRQQINEFENYDHWKKRMLQMAELKLKSSVKEFEMRTN